MRVIHSYPSVYQIGHKAIEDIFNDPVVVQEKVDGSQFSFGIVDGELQCRSKGKQIILDAPEKMFARAIEVVRGLDLRPGLVYRGEYLESPRHNTLCYSRTPSKHIILFDINSGQEEYLPYGAVAEETARIGLEIVPNFFSGKIESLGMFKELLNTDSVLGGQKVEGVVVKNYALFTAEKKVAMGKYVREDFKEQNKIAWRVSNPTQGDIVQSIIATYRNEARWRKAVQHLRERGQLEGSPRDIGLLIREVPEDVLKECRDEIIDALMKHFWKNIGRGITAGLAEWYKGELLKSAFSINESN